jgi:diguanylate cyclase (GGDEF)-like protein
MGFAICCSAAGYAIAGAGRAGTFLVVMGVFMVGMYSLTARQVLRVGIGAMLVFGAAMLLMSHLEPAVYVPEVEWSHFFMLAVMVPTVTVLTDQLSCMRERLRRQKQDLAHALARIQDLATRDELTGLINRRHMGELLEQELHRGVRSGQTFCVALIDVEELPQWIQRHGEAFVDRFLQDFAREALDAIRISDLLARWGRGRFLLMLSDTRSSFARLSVERLRERIQAMSVVPLAGPAANAPSPLKVRLSVGIAEHLAGEAVAQTIARAEQAIDAAHASVGQRPVSMGG